MASFKLGKTKFGFLKTVTSGGTLTLVASSKQFQIFTGTMAHTMKLPDATTTSNGSGISFTVINQSTGVITIQLNDNSTLTTVPAGASIDLLLTDHSTANGTWRISSFSSAGGGGIGSNGVSSISSNYPIVAGDKGKVISVDTSTAITVTLPAPSDSFVVTIKDETGTASINPITVARNASELIDNAASDVVIDDNFGSLSLISDGTNWFRVAKFVLPTFNPIGVFMGGSTGSPENNFIDYVFIATLGNAVDFGDLTVATQSAAGCASATRGVRGGGSASSSESNVIDYFTIASPSNATDFGDLTVARQALGACSNSTRGLFGGGQPSLNVNVIDYITIATTGNAIDFGDLTQGRHGVGGLASPVRGVFGGGFNGSVFVNTIDYVTIASLGNATDFGDLTVSRHYPATAASSTRGVFGGGFTGSPNNTIDYIEIATTANAVDFGDLSVTRYAAGGCSSNIRALFGGGNGPSNVIDYVTIASLGNATDFGDLTVARLSVAACSNAHGGLQ